MQEDNLRRGPWLEDEDEQLTAIVALKGEKRWDSLAKASGLRRSGKSCRLRWMNYLRPNLKHGRLSAEEERTIIQLHKQWGNKWSKIAQRLPGRTDNEIKNYWRSHLRREAEVREQGYCDDHFKNSAKEELLVRPKLGTTSDSKSDVEDFSLITKDDPSQAFEFSNYAIASSPYETRISDWLSSSWSSEPSEVSHIRGNYPSLDSCFSNPVWNSQDTDISIWDSPSSLWDTY